MTITVFEVPSMIEGACFEGVQRALGLLCSAVEFEVDDVALAAAARHYVGAYERWEQAKAWRGAKYQD